MVQTLADIYVTLFSTFTFFIYIFSLLFLLCTLGLILLFGRPTAHERSLKILNVPNYSTICYMLVDSITPGISERSFFTSFESRPGLLCAASLPIAANASICFIAILL